MCGRYGFIDTEQIPERFQATQTSLFEARYNAAPGQRLPVVFREGAENAAAPMRWGLVPSWAKSAKIGYKMINARVETAAEKPSYKGPLRSRRCLIPANWFYEWKAEPGGKVPYLIRRKDRALFAIAGLYDVWRRPGEEPIQSFTIITGRPNRLVGKIHARMPVILNKQDEQAWLSPTTDVIEFLKNLKPYGGGGLDGTGAMNEIDHMKEVDEIDQMEAYPVSTLVNSARHDSPELILPL